MIEYGFEDIIINPEDPRLEGAIGKECYLSDYPKEALDNARNDSMKYRLVRIDEKEICPFVDHEYEDNWSIVIIKKEEPKPKYVPFESKGEFIESYMDNRSNHEYLDHQISCLGGIWLKDKDIEGVFYIVTEMWRDGVVLGSDQSTTKWDDLLYGYTFIDGSPCGKEVEE